MTATVYSPRLGAISDEQLAEAAARLGLGGFVSASPIASGMHGQNLFLTTTAGEFVLRGAPHWVKRRGEAGYHQEDRLQFTKETWFVDRLHEHTRAPAPWPCLHDQASDIFGWPYLVMPRMPGACYNERSIRKALAPEDRREVAAAAGALLAELQTLTSPFSGDFDPDTIALTPDPAGYVEHMVRFLADWAATAEAKGLMTQVDMDWTQDAARAARQAGERPISFVHGDYKLDNLTVANAGGGWRVSGVFDFQTARFGDGAFDLVRQASAYLDTEPALARVFLDAWRADGPGEANLEPLLPLYVAAERIGIWQAFAAADPRPAWADGKTFRDWAEPYLSRILDLL